MADCFAVCARLKFDDNITREVVFAVDIGERYDMLDLLSDDGKLPIVSDRCPLMVDALDGKPVLVLDRDAVAAKGSRFKMFDVTAYANAVRKEQQFDAYLNAAGTTPDARAAEFKASIAKAQPAMPGELLDYWYDFAVERYVPYMKGGLTVRPRVQSVWMNSKRTAEVRDAIDKMKLASSETARYVSSGQNVATFQEKPEDRFYIPLPQYEEFKRDDVGNDALLHDLGQIFKPFAHRAYYSPAWMELRGVTERRRHELMSNILLEDGSTYSGDEIENWVDYPTEHILGSPDNDEFPVMDNEAEWVNAFIRFVRFDLEQSYEKDVADELFASGGLSGDMESYYDYVLEEVLRRNWGCAGMFKIRVPDKDDDDDDDSSDGGVGESLYFKCNAMGFDGMEAVRSFVKRAARGSSARKPGGCAVYAEALVKLARWGDRRPAHLKLDSDPDLFSLSKFSVVNKPMDFSKLEVKKTNGRELSLLGFVTHSWAVSEAAYGKSLGVSGVMKNVPVGFVAVRSFAGPREISQLVYVSLLDMLEQYTAGNQFVDGITLGKDGRFVTGIELDEGGNMELSDVMKSLGADSSGQTKAGYAVYLSKRLGEVARETQVKAYYMSDFAVMHKFSEGKQGAHVWTSEFVLGDRSDLMQIQLDKGMNAKDAMQLGVLRHIAPLYFRYADQMKEREFDETVTAADHLDTFYRASETLGVRDSTGFYTVNAERKPPNLAGTVKTLAQFGGVTQAEPKPAVQPPIAKMDKFGGAEDLTSDWKKRYLFADMGQVKNVHPVFMAAKVDGKDANVTVGYCAQMPVTVGGKAAQAVLLMAVDELPPSAVKTGYVVYNSLTKHLLRAFGDIMSGNVTEPGRLMFATEGTAMKLYAAVQRQG